MWLLFYIALFLSVLLPASISSAVKPNFLILFVDDMGYSQPSYQPLGGDNGTIATPHIDQLASEGMVFTDWYSAFHVCSPSRAAMVTGRLPIRTGIGPGVLSSEAIGGLPNNETTFAEALSQAGYITGAMGKWHMGQRPKFYPTNHGFDSYYGIPFSCDMGISAWKYYNQSHPKFQSRPLPLLNGTRGNVKIIEQPVNLGTLTERYVSHTIDFITSAAKSKKPFVYYMAFNHVHAPNFVSKKFCGSSKRGPVGDTTQEVDDAIGQVLDALHKLGLDDSTVVFFTSDNGAPLSNDCLGNGPLREGKTTTWEGGIRMPAIIRWTNHIPSGRSSELTGTYDIFSTMMNLADVPLPTDRVIDGKDLTELLLSGGKSGKGHECLFHYHDPDAHPEAIKVLHGVSAVRCGKYKAHYKTTSGGGDHCGQTLPVPNGLYYDNPVLFDLEADIGEFHPIKNTTTEYTKGMDIISKALKAHLSTITYVPNQMTNKHGGVGGDDLSMAVCKDLMSRKKYPQYPNCTSDPHNFEVWHSHAPTC